jgi:transcriptional regulator with XRE-family HTH domain
MGTKIYTPFVVCIGRELRSARELARLSRRQVTERIPGGISERTIIAYESGTRELQLTRLIELCRAIGVDPATTFTVALRRSQTPVDDRCPTCLRRPEQPDDPPWMT